MTRSRFVNDYYVIGPDILLLFLCVPLFGCVDVQPKKADPTPSPEIRVIERVDIVERADQMCKTEGDCRQALLLYNQAFKERGESSELFKKRGMAYYSLKEFELAIADFSAAIELQKDVEKKDAELFFIRGLSRSLKKEEDRSGACGDITEAVRAGWKTEETFDRWYTGYCTANK